jgi:hypothetical protein
MPEYDDETLELIMREGLESRAASAATQLIDPPGPRGGVVRRPRRRLVALAAAAAVAVTGGVSFAALHSGGPGQVAVDPGQVPADWRYESYQGVQVRVPPTWGWGGEPTGSGDQLIQCGDPVAVVPETDGAATQDGMPYVGRPVMMSDACQGGLAGSALWPQASAVWLGSPLPAGTDTAADGRVATTVAVGGQHVTVFSTDAGLRAQILSTAEAATVDGNGCPSDPIRVPAPGPVDDRAPASMSVCVYDEGRLLWSSRHDAQQAADYVDAFERASATYDPSSLCSSEPAGQWVAIGVDYGVAGTRWDIANFECPALVGTYTYGSRGKQSPTQAPLTPLTVSPWAGGGVKAYVAGPVDPHSADLSPYFRGMLG